MKFDSFLILVLSIMLLINSYILGYSVSKEKVNNCIKKATYPFVLQGQTIQEMQNYMEDYIARDKFEYSPTKFDKCVGINQ